MLYALSIAASSAGTFAEVGLGDGSDGPAHFTLSQALPSGVALVADVPLNGTELVVSTTTGFAPGSLVLVWHAIGAPRALNGMAPVDLGTAGVFEWAHILAVDSGLQTLIIDTPMPGIEAFGTQVIKVPQYTDLRIDPGVVLSAAPFDGETGGIIVVLVTGTLFNEGVLDASGVGLRPGPATQAPFCSEDGKKGEGHDGVLQGEGRGHEGAGGGGGACFNAGGGGGAHRGAGGRGGDQWRLGVDGGGDGGAFVAPTQDRFVLGGGGGGGHADNNGANAGGRGGGVLFSAAADFQGFGSFFANGEDVATISIDGAGGGGGGGMVVLLSLNEIDCGMVQAHGGHGGDVSSAQHGPGGGGGGGSVTMAPVGKPVCQVSVTAGASGVAGSDPFGAEPGGIGVLEPSADVPYTDNDGDGHFAEVDDCADSDPSVFLGAVEVCWDAVDNDCDNLVNEGCDTGDTGTASNLDGDSDTDADSDADADSDTDTDSDIGPGASTVSDAVSGVAQTGCRCQASPIPPIFPWIRRR